MSDSWVKASKTEWSSPDKNNSELRDDALKIGCLQRIARSLENMETPYAKLLSDVKWFKERHADLIKENQKLYKRISGYKGALKRKGSVKL